MTTNMTQSWVRVYTDWQQKGCNGGELCQGVCNCEYLYECPTCKAPQRITGEDMPNAAHLNGECQACAVAPNAIEISYDGGEDVIVSFDDNTHVMFEPYRHGWGYQVEGLRRCYVLKGKLHRDSIVFIYNSRLYRCGPQADEHKIKRLDAPYTQTEMAMYWKAAMDYCTAKHKEDSDTYWYAWRVATEGWQDLQRLQKGEAEIAPVEE